MLVLVKRKRRPATPSSQTLAIIREDTSVIDRVTGKVVQSVRDYPFVTSIYFM